MTYVQPLHGEKTRPLVAVLCAVPLLGEAVVSALDFAEVRSFSSRAGDLSGLLAWLRPDALVVDSDEAASEAISFAQEHVVPLLHISVREHELRLFRRGGWEKVSNGEGPTPEGVRNVVAGALYAREATIR
jgi:hypothetical protein